MVNVQGKMLVTIVRSGIMFRVERLYDENRGSEYGVFDVIVEGKEIKSINVVRPGEASEYAVRSLIKEIEVTDQGINFFSPWTPAPLLD
jgi:hypothetical protein